MKNAKSKTTAPQNRYRKWVAAGKPYHKGLSLLNEISGFDVLKRNLKRGPSTYNTPKLDGVLRMHFDKPTPGQAPPPKADRLNGHTHRQRVSDPPPAQELPPPADDAATDEGAADSAAPPPADEGGDGDDDEDPGSVPEAYTPKTWKARAFSELPEPLKKLRIATIKDIQRRSMLHAELATDPPDRKRRLLLCQEIVTITDRTNAHWAIEETWTTTGAMPHLDEDEEQRIASTDIFKLQRELANQVAPQLSRLTFKLKEDNRGTRKLSEEERTATEMRIGALQRTKALIKQRLLEYQQQLKA